MLNSSETGLAIFDNFSIDRELPKWKKIEKITNNGVENDQDRMTMGGSFVRFDRDGVNPMPSNGVEIGTGMASHFVQRDLRGGNLIFPNKSGWLEMKKDSLWLRFKIMWRFLNNKDFKRNLPMPTLTIQEYFRSIKMGCEELQKLDDRMNGYVAAVNHAEQFGQKALADDLKSRIEIIKHESRMFSIGLVKVITEEQVVTFTKEAEKGIQLMWIRNFSRIIPASLLELKKKADDLEIFDNYVVMSYDPHKKSYKETIEEAEKRKAAEEAKRRDPILFGVLKDSRKLYYIGSWEDEFCDLTLDKFIEKFGAEAITKNDINVNQY